MRGHHPDTDDDSPSYPLADIQPIGEDQIRAVYQFMYQHVGNREDAESLTGRACIQALRMARGLPDGQTLEQILGQTVRSVVTEHLRWFYGAVDLDGEDLPDDEPGDTPTRVRCILDHLPRRERDFLIGRFLDNASLDETAATLHLTLSEARALQWYALTQAGRLARVRSEGTLLDAMTRPTAVACAHCPSPQITSASASTYCARGSRVLHCEAVSRRR